jgi:hypothetical protein
MATEPRREIHLRTRKPNTSVALQQKSSLPFTGHVDYSSLTNAELHHSVLEASASLQRRCIEAYQHETELLAQPFSVLIPACEEIIRRYKMQGVAAKDRPNEQPTVEAYFRSVSLNYNTVRSWFYRHRERFEKMMSQLSVVPKPTRAESIAAAGYAAIEAYKTGVNADEAVKAFKAVAPARKWGFGEEPNEPTNDGKLPKLALRMVCEVESFFNGRSKQTMPKKLRAVVDKLKAELEP